MKELQQLNSNKVFIPKLFHDLTHEQRKKALRAITVIKEKRCGKLKGRTCADGRKQREEIDPKDATSPTVSTEALLLSCAIDASENRHVATADIEGAFLKANMDNFVVVVFEGTSAELMVRTNPEFAPYLYTTKAGKKILLWESL